jgi:hypothetical protein
LTTVATGYRWAGTRFHQRHAPLAHEGLSPHHDAPSGIAMDASGKALLPCDSRTAIAQAPPCLDVLTQVRRSAANGMDADKRREEALGVLAGESAGAVPWPALLLSDTEPRRDPFR